VAPKDEALSDRSGSRWTEPHLIAEIAYSNWTTDGAMRHPQFIGLREDKAALDVRLERARKVPRQ
jgi:bifunctional non-homologous end joining protein LigD